MRLEPHQPKTKQEFWCNHCDSRIVKSDVPESGKFFLQSGHSYSAKTKEFDGAYLMVMFALCPNCIGA